VRVQQHPGRPARQGDHDMTAGAGHLRRLTLMGRRRLTLAGPAFCSARGGLDAGRSTEEKGRGIGPGGLNHRPFGIFIY
jgi:hypothetical protein